MKKSKKVILCMVVLLILGVLYFLTPKTLRFDEADILVVDKINNPVSNLKLATHYRCYGGVAEFIAFDTTLETNMEGKAKIPRIEERVSGLLNVRSKSSCQRVVSIEDDQICKQNTCVYLSNDFEKEIHIQLK